MFIESLEEWHIAQAVRRTVTAALYEAKVSDEEILRLLKKYCDLDNEDAVNTLCNEKFIYAPCRALTQYLILEKGYNSEEAERFVHIKAKRALAENVELRKMPVAKLFDAIENT